MKKEIQILHDEVMELQREYLDEVEILQHEYRNKTVNKPLLKLKQIMIKGNEKLKNIEKNIGFKICINCMYIGRGIHKKGHQNFDSHDQFEFKFFNCRIYEK